MANKKIMFSRKDFIGEPFTHCPGCHQKTFGVCIGMAPGNFYEKECTHCPHRTRYALPDIKKRVIYLDQFVIDNIVKSLDPKHPRHDAATKEPFWMEAYKKLDILTRAQLIVCPDSFFHREESGPTGYFESMQRIYEHFSGGITFDRGEQVVRWQICEHFGNYLRGTPEILPVTMPENIVREDLHQWHGKLQISVNMKPRQAEVTEILQGKARTYANFLEIFERWKTEKHKHFDDWHKEETRGFATGAIESIKSFAERRARAPEKYLSDGTVDLNNILPPPTLEMIEAMERTAYKEGITDPAEARKKIGEYLFSDNLEKVPAVRIGSLLYAALADQAARGRVQPPSPGVLVDVDMITSFLPYCEAIFLDKENAALLEHGRVKEKLGTSTRIFSLRNKEDFLAYLDEILESADKKHLEFVEHVYGLGWKNPYLTILSRG